jgi:hypothetical protein
LAIRLSLSRGRSPVVVVVVFVVVIVVVVVGGLVHGFFQRPEVRVQLPQSLSKQQTRKEGGDFFL